MSKIEYFKTKCDECGGSLTKREDVLICNYCKKEYHIIQENTEDNSESENNQKSLDSFVKKVEKPKWSILQRLFFSPFVLKEKRSRKVAYIAIMVALSIVCNIFFEFKLGTVQYSLTTVVSCLIGVLLGPIGGFIACFIGDMVGFFVHPFGAYTPWIGLATGLMAFISGVVFHFNKSQKGYSVYLKCIIVAFVTFLICSLAINSTFLWVAYYNKTEFTKFLITRYFIQGQILVSALNYAILIVLLPVIKRVPFFKSLDI